jgi:heparin lyase
MKSYIFIYLFSAALSVSIGAQAQQYITTRVDVQGSIAPDSAVIDGEWVAVGTKASYAIARDSSRMIEGKPSFRFELKQTDNTLAGYNEGETKGRAELCYCYATADDIKQLSQKQFENAVIARKVYHFGKGEAPQGSHYSYRFSIYVPHDLSADVNTIFAQWHGMPDRTLLKTTDGIVKKVSDDEFARLSDTVLFKKDTGYDKVPILDARGRQRTDINGKPRFKTASEPNGWMVEQGGYPPLAFGFSNGWFYIKANSDRKWMTDKSDRCNINPEKGAIMQPVTSNYKASTIVWKEPFDDFPKDSWVTFVVDVRWTTYGGELETITSPGLLDVTMAYIQNGETVKHHIVDNATVLIGRNDDKGYYFKFGIYRVGGSTVPVCYNLGAYEQAPR